MNGSRARPSGPAHHVAFACVLLAVVPARSARADGLPAESTSPNAFDLTVRSETYAELFRRALLPGPNGAVVETHWAAPIHEYVYLAARDIDTSWADDAIDVELAAWGRSWLGDQDESEGLRRLDGDVQTAFVGYRQGPVLVRLGRQHAAGGAARYVRFDGLAASVALGKSGLEAGAYGGFTALPRWDARPGYHHLGSAADSLLRDPEALPPPERSGYFLAGGSLRWTGSRALGGVSLHEQREAGELSRRTLGFDARAFPVKGLVLGGSTLVEVDAWRLADARGWLDASPTEALDVSVEALHIEPALFLSRQSVLSVFGTDAYEETGGSIVARLHERFQIESGGWVQFYDENHRGARGEVGLRALPGHGGKTVARVGYARVLSVGNGYHSVRTSLSHRAWRALTGTLELYGYLYDQPIRGRSSSAVTSGTIRYDASDALSLLVGASVSQSPYARLDAQALARASLRFDLSRRPEGP